MDYNEDLDLNKELERMYIETKKPPAPTSGVTIVSDVTVVDKEVNKKLLYELIRNIDLTGTNRLVVNRKINELLHSLPF